MKAGQPFIPSPRNQKEESQMCNPWKTNEPFQVVLFDGIDLVDWYLCKNYVKNLVPDSNAEVLSHQQNFKAQRFCCTFP
jgi:hypothetical protein